MPRLLAAGLVAVIANTASAVSFDLRFSNDAFFDTNTTQGQQARAAVTAAANFFALRLNDNLGAITPGGVNSWTATYTDPSTGGAGSAMNLTVAAGQLVVFIGARDLGGSTLGEGGPGGFSASGTSAFLSSVSTRGQGVTQGAGATDFGPWGGVAGVRQCGHDLDIRSHGLGRGRHFRPVLGRAS